MIVSQSTQTENWRAKEYWQDTWKLWWQNRKRQWCSLHFLRRAVCWFEIRGRAGLSAWM